MAGITFGEASHVADSVFGNSQYPIRQIIEKRAEKFEEEDAVAPLIFNMEKTDKPIEKLTAMTAMEGFTPVGENGGHPVSDMEESYSKILEQETWKNSFAISREAIDDSIALDLKKKPAQFVLGYYRTREQFAAAILGGAIKLEDKIAFKGRNFNCQGADGKDLFATDHPSKVSGAAQSNYFADAFSLDAMSYMESKMQMFCGDNDNLLNVAPNTILIPNDPALKRAVFAAVGSDKDPDTANNGWNFQFGKWRILIWAYLNKYITAGTSPWIMLDPSYNEEYTGALWLDRVPLEVRSSIDENTDSNIWRGYARFSAGFNDWRFAAVGGVAGGTALL